MIHYFLMTELHLIRIDAHAGHSFDLAHEVRNCDVPASTKSVSCKPRVFAQPITTRGFTGHEMVDDMGIIHMNGRIYDARIGRFLQADPFIQAAANTQSYNRYSYVMNNPLNATDPNRSQRVYELA